MILLLLTVGFVLLAAPGLQRMIPRRLPAREYVPVALVAVIGGWLALESALVLIALPTVAHALGVAHIADACHHVLAPLPSSPGIVGWAAAFAGAATIVRLLLGIRRAWRQACRARAEPWLGAHDAFGQFDLVVLPVGEPLIYGVPGVPPQVVISQGTIDQLPHHAVDAVIAHEAAHHRLRHPYCLAALQGIESSLGALPGVRRSLATIRDALEVWADAAAAKSANVGSGLRDALLHLGTQHHPASRERRWRLERTPNNLSAAVRALCYSPVAFLSVLALVVAVDWLATPHHAAALGISCNG